VSDNFKLDYSSYVKWIVGGLSQAQANRVSFSVMKDVTMDRDKPLLPNLKTNATSWGYTPGNYYIGQLRYTDSTGTYKGDDVFTPLGVSSFTITVTPVSSPAPASNES